VAYFLNHYLGFNVPETQVSFRKIWYDKNKTVVRQSLETSRNWPLSGLYWLSKDLFETSLSDVMEPEAEELAALRNHLEHKYVKVHWLAVPKIQPAGASIDLFKDTLAYSISRDDLERRTLHVMRLAREALIYLSLGMHAEERRRRALSPAQGLAMPIELPTLDDGEKRRL
jgi:LA2681-like HEPN